MVMTQSDEWDILLGSDFMEIDKPSILVDDPNNVFQDGTVVDFFKDDDKHTKTLHFVLFTA